MAKFPYWSAEKVVRVRLVRSLGRLRRRLRCGYAFFPRLRNVESPAGTQWWCAPFRGLEYRVVNMGAGVAQVGNSPLTPLTRARLVAAALLPWFALFSGTYGQFFYLVPAAAVLAPWLPVLAMAIAAPLAALLLLILPVGALRAAMGRPPLGRRTGGCVRRPGRPATPLVVGGWLVAVGRRRVNDATREVAAATGWCHQF